MAAASRAVCFRMARARTRSNAPARCAMYPRPHRLASGLRRRRRAHRPRQRGAARATRGPSPRCARPSGSHGSTAAGAAARGGWSATPRGQPSFQSALNPRCHPRLLLVLAHADQRLGGARDLEAELDVAGALDPADAAGRSDEGGARAFPTHSLTARPPFASAFRRMPTIPARCLEGCGDRGSRISGYRPRPAPRAS